MLLPILNEKEKIVWTNHSKDKMRYYRFSEKRVLSILRKPGRKEEGIAEGTIAAMQPSGTKKNPKEIWMMYQIVNSKLKNQNLKLRKIKIISAWRYPGVTPLGQRPILPDDTISKLKEILKNN
ncbi:MAG: hypothetical protein ABIG40_03010 [Parcubacteria group bacterium]